MKHKKRKKGKTKNRMKHEKRKKESKKERNDGKETRILQKPK